ncbi:hypothetical protein [Pseudomarimonas arenosa]|uniref:Ribosomal protein L7/L12 C-terminal domain-containing protein n=1 Tax=Pseudomarimonas arenosa TaxID=2774145 RepID=A0AAW3ZLB1_9GAMM|nr:hypothetical protein [Pseudomarimonas arenosa]MBD8526753.1 hypothetical protein [Pseudomarimonas arenosa]
MATEFVVVFGAIAALLLLGAILALWSGLRGAVTNADGDGALARIERKLDLLLDNAGLRYDPLDGLPLSIQALVKQGKTIEAIKLYREAKGVGLKAAKEAIDEIRRLG